MSENEITDCTNTETEEKMQTEPPELDATPQFHFADQKENNNVPKEKTGNGLEKNGQKRLQTTPIEATDLSSKKPRMEAPEEVNIKTKEPSKDETHITKKGDGKETDLLEKTDEDETDLLVKEETALLEKADEYETNLIEKADMVETDLRETETDLNKVVKEDKTHLIENKDGDELHCDKKEGGEITDLSKKGGEITDHSKKSGEITDLSKKGGEITDLSKKGGEITDLSKKDGEITDLSKKSGEIMDLNNKSGQIVDLNKKGGEIRNLNNKGEEEMDIVDDDEEYYLTVHNMPSDWTYMQIKNYLDQECGHVDEMEMLKHRKSKNCAIRLTFQSIHRCIDAFKKLENKSVHDKKLRVKISDTYTSFPMGGAFPSSSHENLMKQFSISNEIIATRWRPDLDCLDTDPEGLYGLRPEFLKALDIKPPLNKMVDVTNFRCDKAELKEVMEIAGQVLMCCVVQTVPKYAKVMYSHPLEAVQAISMLNGQLLYGSPLKICMDKNPADSVVLPKGLANIGQGLGIKARPVRNIVQQYHRYANKQSASINPIIFSEIDFSDEYVNKIRNDENKEEIEKKIREFITTRPGCNVVNPIVQFKVQNIDQMGSPEGITTSDSSSIAKSKVKNNNVGSVQGQVKKGAENKQSAVPPAKPVVAPPKPLVRLGKPSPPFMPPNMVMAPGPMRNPLSMPGPRDPFFRPGPPQEPPFRPRVPFIPPPMRRPPFPQPRPPFGPPAGFRPPPPLSMTNFNGPRANVENRVNVMFSNLPPSTTFPLLCDLLAQCGQVMSVQLTTPGCAVATFGHPSHAERCYQSFNGMNMEGYTVAVTFA